MISPQLHSEVSSSCPPGSSLEPFNASLEHAEPLPDAASSVVATGTEMTARRTTDVVVNGLWHTLLVSLAAGLAVSAVLAVVVLAIGQIG